jgi:hypothetical protein
VTVEDLITELLKQPKKARVIISIPDIMGKYDEIRITTKNNLLETIIVGDKGQ